MDSVLLYIESNGIFAILLLVLLINMGDSTVTMWEEKLFKSAMILNISVLIADTGCWIFDGYIAFDTVWINKLVYCAYYILTMAFVFVWTLYMVYKLQVNRIRLKKLLPFLVIPAMVAMAMAVISLWSGWLYWFKEDGTYVRGPLFPVHTLIMWLYFCAALFIAGKVVVKRELSKLSKEGKAIIISILFPVIGGLIQTMHYGFNLAWTASCISFVIIFISIQNRQMVMDALTGIYNRGALSKYLQDNIHRPEGENRLYVIVFDVNKFKRINDTYGHIVGDKTLVEVSKMMSDICKQEGKADFLARYGGDEFVLVCKRKSAAEVEALVEKIRAKSKYLQGKIEIDLPVSLSIGWTEYHADMYKTEDAFLADADRKMYIDKEKSRSEN